MALTEFEKLLSQVNKLNLIEGEKCLICHFPDKKENLTKLSCNHYFHLKCLNCKTNLIICPYCQKSTKLKNLYCQSNNICNVILKNGKNKGKVCGRKNCRYHKVVETGCNVILKSGARKGEKCNRINCKYHNKSIVV
tara:strand:- start:1489 stop:1899 length:411 start_codon:yes stop_codon:yes gene_type:complete